MSGATLRARFGLLDTWAYFTSIGTRKKPPPTRRTRAPAAPRRRRREAPPARAPRSLLAGTVYPERAGAEVQIQVRTGDRWRTVTRTVVRRGGRYSAAVAAAGTYRAIFSGDAGPSVRVG